MLSRTARIASGSLALIALVALHAHAETPKGVHLRNAKSVGVPISLQDGGKNPWVLQSAGNVSNMPNRAYSNGMRIQVEGRDISFGSRKRSRDGREVEFGPYTHNNLRLSRRVRVFEEAPLARWLEIVENTSDSDRTVRLRQLNYFYYSSRSRYTSSGDGTFDPSDTAFITTPSNSRPPSILHVVATEDAEVRPSVSFNSSRVYMNYSVKVPAGKTVVICTFQGQNKNVGELKKLMKDFKARTYLRDLPASARRLIVNMKVRGGEAGIELDRNTRADVALLGAKQPVYGTVANKRYTLNTRFGEYEIPADRMVGMAAASGEGDEMLALLSDGQVVRGSLGDQVLRLRLRSGGELKIPFGKMRQWSYRITEDRPEEFDFDGPYVVLNDGSRLAVGAEELDLSLLTRHGKVPLNHEALCEVVLRDEESDAHYALFRNESRLAGLVMHEDLSLKLRLGKTSAALSRDRVAKIEFAPEADEVAAPARCVLSNGDTLRGVLGGEAIALETPYGELDLESPTVRAVTVTNKPRPGSATVELWDGSVLRGRLSEARVRFTLTPGPELKLHVAQIKQIVRTQALPPEEVRKRVEKLVARLGAESYQDRQAATKKLVEMKADIVPLLRYYLRTSKDPEVRNRIDKVIDKLGGSPAGPVPPPALVLPARRL